MITAEEWQLISFFEAEPDLSEEYMPWPYNDFVFASKVGPANVVCEISPSYSDVTLSIQRDGFHYEVSARALHDVRYLAEGGIETLELWLTRTHSISIQLKPEISIRERRTGTYQDQFDN